MTGQAPFRSPPLRSSPPRVRRGAGETSPERERVERPKWRSLPVFALACEIMWGCGAPRTPSASTGAPPTSPPAAGFADDLAPLSHYHSRRLAVTLALPDGKAWRIDDHSRPELVATHNPTESKVVVAVFHTDEIVGRAQCEALSRSRNLVPAGDLRTLEDKAAFTQDAFDTRVWVAVDAGGGPTGSLVGYVMAFGGLLRKCYAFVFSTQVRDPSEEPVLASRLAFARARILGGLALDDVLQPRLQR